MTTIQARYLNQTTMPRKKRRLSYAALTAKYAPDNAIEFRGSHDPERFSGTLFSLSQSGLFIKTQNIPEMGSPVLMHFRFCGKKVQCQGQIIYVNRVGDGMRPQGFGVKFTRIIEEDYKTIGNAVETFYSKFN